MPNTLQPNPSKDTTNIRVMVVDDHPLMLSALHRMLSTELPQARIFNNNSMVETLRQLRTEPCDLVLLDLFLDHDNTSPLSDLTALIQEFPNLPIAVMTGNDRPDLENLVMQAGARAFISKRSNGHHICRQLMALLPAKFGQAATTPVSQSLTALTGRKQEILNLLAQGKNNKEISQLLNISLHTVKSHVSLILSSLQVSSRAKAAALIKTLDLDLPNWRNHTQQ